MTQAIETNTLYRKYRPHVFADVIGQDEVVQTLQNQISSGSIAHAYLFSGGRGTGKTSIARIFAHELGTDDQDIYEIDAASNRGINEIREVRDGVANRPFASTYKVYIIDEVHMLTKEAFNALLKTLEEPPAHVIFILATTEKHKVLDTILSRCQVYDFKLASTDNLVQSIMNIVESENRVIDQESALYIAEMGNGSYRDTQSYLQKVLANIKDDVTIKEVQERFSVSDQELEISLLAALSEKDKTKLFEVYHQMLDSKQDINQTISVLTVLTRSVLLLRYDGSYKQILSQQATENRIEQLSSFIGITSHTLRDLLHATELITSSGHPAESFEVFLFEQVAKWEE